MGHPHRRRGAAQQSSRYPTSAKLSYKRYEFDVGWLYIRVLEALGLARVKHVAPVPRFTEPRSAVDPETLQAVVANRYDVLAKYARSLKRAFAEEIGDARRPRGSSSSSSSRTGAGGPKRAGSGR